jgi:hypothetical protein
MALPSRTNATMNPSCARIAFALLCFIPTTFGTVSSECCLESIDEMPITVKATMSTPTRVSNIRSREVVSQIERLTSFFKLHSAHVRLSRSALFDVLRPSSSGSRQF